MRSGTADVHACLAAPEPRDARQLRAVSPPAFETLCSSAGLGGLRRGREQSPGPPERGFRGQREGHTEEPPQGWESRRPTSVVAPSRQRLLPSLTRCPHSQKCRAREKTARARPEETRTADERRGPRGARRLCATSNRNRERRPRRDALRASAEGVRIGTARRAWERPAEGSGSRRRPYGGYKERRRSGSSQSLLGTISLSAAPPGHARRARGSMRTLAPGGCACPERGKQRHSPGSAASEHQRDGVSRQHPRQAGEVRVPIWGLLEQPLVQLHLRDASGRGWAARRTPRLSDTHRPAPSAAPGGQEAPTPAETLAQGRRALRAQTPGADAAARTLAQSWGQAGCAPPPPGTGTSEFALASTGSSSSAEQPARPSGISGSPQPARRPEGVAATCGASQGLQ